MAKMTGAELVSFCRSKIGTPYLYGAKGEMVTKDDFDDLQKRYGKVMVPTTDAKKVGKVCVDCSGLVSWACNRPLNSAGWKSSASQTNPIGTIKNAPLGALLWRSGHIGVYSGMKNGEPYYVAADNSRTGVHEVPISKNNFTHWLLIEDVFTYETKNKLESDATMKINVHAGHAPDGGTGCGAVGLIKESTEARKVAATLIDLLKAQGHTVYDCTVTTNMSAGSVLTNIVKKCNAHTVDLDVSIHFNSGAKDQKGNGKTTGTEVLIYSTGGASEKYAKNIADAIAALGFKNRGVKVRKDLYFLRSTKAQALLVECCFVDDKDDVALYDAAGMAQAIAKGIAGKTAQAKPVNAAQAATASQNGTFKVKIKVNELNIRTGPGTEYDVVGCIKDKGTYTIIKTNGKWGQLKSRAGWINISSTYATKVN